MLNVYAVGKFGRTLPTKNIPLRFAGWVAAGDRNSFKIRNL